MTELELQKLTEACRAVPEAQGTYLESEYLVNVFLTVLDLQMHNKAVDAAIGYYRQHRQQEVQTIDDVSALLAQHADDQDGNRQVAQFLWGNNHWTRVQWLRSLVQFLVQNGVGGQKSI